MPAAKSIWPLQDGVSPRFCPSDDDTWPRGWSRGCLGDYKSRKEFSCGSVMAAVCGDLKGTLTHTESLCQSVGGGGRFLYLWLLWHCHDWVCRTKMLPTTASTYSSQPSCSLSFPGVSLTGPRDRDWVPPTPVISTQTQLQNIPWHPD